jgi:integrase
MSHRNRIPSYRLHKQSGQAIVTLPNGLGGRRDVLLGAYDTPESRAEYLRVLAEWEAAGRGLRRQDVGASLTVAELILAYWRHCEGYYVKNGTPTTQLDRIRHALRPVRELYGFTAARDFGPKALKAVRQHMLTLPCGHCKGTGTLKKVPCEQCQGHGTIKENPCEHCKRTGNQLARRPKNRRSGNLGEICGRCDGAGQRGWARGLINAAIGCIKRMFKWAVAEELIPPSVYHGLTAVEGLRKGRSEARETKPIRSVADEHVEAVLPLLTPPVRAMVQVQRLSGMRPGEVILLRPCDVDRSHGRTWIYRPEAHKTEHHDAVRVVFLGPKAQAILAPFLDRDPGAYCFSPREAVADLRARQRAARKSKVQPSQQDRRQRAPQRTPGEHYTTDTYGNAIERACLKAGVPPWHPHQLRHSAATEVRREVGLDAARAVLGHACASMTEHYAEVDAEKAAQAMERLG